VTQAAPAQALPTLPGLPTLPTFFRLARSNWPDEPESYQQEPGEFQSVFFNLGNVGNVGNELL
jgi:hypothetical protein